MPHTPDETLHLSERIQMGRQGQIIDDGNRSHSQAQPTDGMPTFHVKKRKKERSGVDYPRKRALIACEACRQRKIKCDNHRPTCGSCKDLDIECNLGDLTKKQTTYDIASLEILERINYVAGLVETQRDTLSECMLRPLTGAVISPFTANTGLCRPAWHLNPSPGSLPYSEGSVSFTSNQNDAEILLESLEIAGRNPQVSEDVLDWPIFEQRYDRARIETLIFNPRSQSSCNLDSTAQQQTNSTTVSFDPVRTSKASRGVEEEDAPHLINRFLLNVHIKNPVLDAEDLRRKGRWILEHGFGWDAASCLVLIVCALAKISSKFKCDTITPGLVDGEHSMNSISATPDYSTAESYYVAAQKRIALLESSIIATQCYFLTGVYEMYSLRPLRAWASFNRACITLQIYFRGQEPQEFVGSKGVERRLYWSCLKSECEIRMEINLPSSGLAKVNYPDVFPTPPTGSPEPPDHSSIPMDRTGSLVSFSTRGLESDQEQIWKYYLSEIAVRKIGNRLMNCFYKEDESAWLSMPLDRMIRVADELNLQLTQWFQNLPSTLAKTEAQISDMHNRQVTDELQFVLHARLNDFRERIYRPFLYLAIHYAATNPIQQRLALYVQRCIEACLTCLLRGCPLHRHHGTWYENRGMFLKSLLLIAAVKSGKIHVPESWRRGVELCIAGFKFWEREGPDLCEARSVLESLLENLSSSAL